MLAVAISALKSPSRSPTATLLGAAPVPKSVLAANELLLIVPLVAVLRNTDTVLDVELAVTISAWPSPLMSPIAMLYGLPPVVKSTFAASEPEPIVPLVAVLTEHRN